MHHLLLAATISAALVRLHSTILDKALDLVTHYVILGLLDPAERPGSPPGEYPTVLILMPAVVSDERLAGLVRTVTATWRRPAEPHLRRVLVFAMDLAPLPQEKHKAELIWQKDLDDALDRAVQDGIRVVLEKPFFQESPVLGTWCAWPGSSSAATRAFTSGSRGRRTRHVRSTASRPTCRRSA